MPVFENLFEVSWEVANKVGGIYTVIATKTGLMKQIAKNYYLIGPFIKNKSNLDAKIMQAPQALQPVLKSFQDETGVKVYYGKWHAPGNPQVLLLDFYGFMKDHKDFIKAKLWEWHKVDSLFSSFDFEEPVTWAWTVGMLIQSFFNFYKDKNFASKTVVHFHEWLSGAGLLYLKQYLPSIKTVFTTHATMLGRTLAGNGRDLFKELKTNHLNPDQEAINYKVQDKHGVEKACALTTNVLTTVSEITAFEVEKLLSRKPDLVLPNGIAIEKFPTLEEIALKHVTARERIREFLTYYFFPYYTFKLEHNLLMFISGRYEFFNKGIDLTIHALAKLNNYLKTLKTHRTITVFFFIPMPVRGIKFEVLENKNYYTIISNYVQEHSKQFYKNVITALVAQKKLSPEAIFGDEFLQEITKDIYTFKRQGNPPISTHDIINEDQDLIIKTLLSLGLDNKPDDKVKVVVFPVYLTGTDGLLDLKYYEAISGFHLGIFPSYYEPWGYTPLECLAMGVPSVTTDTSGFGQYALKLAKSKKKLQKNGLYVIQRNNKQFEDSVNQLFEVLKHYSLLDHPTRVRLRVSAKIFSNQFQWRYLIKHYKKAYLLALNKKS